MSEDYFNVQDMADLICDEMGVSRWCPEPLGDFIWTVASHDAARTIVDLVKPLQARIKELEVELRFAIAQRDTWVQVERRTIAELEAWQAEARSLLLGVTTHSFNNPVPVRQIREFLEQIKEGSSEQW